MKDAEERLVKSELAYKAIVYNDQLVVERDTLIGKINETTTAILESKNSINGYNSELETNIISTDDKGQPLSRFGIQILIKKHESLIQKSLMNLRQ